MGKEAEAESEGEAELADADGWIEEGVAEARDEAADAKLEDATGCKTSDEATDATEDKALDTAGGAEESDDAMDTMLDTAGDCDANDDTADTTLDAGGSAEEAPGTKVVAAGGAEMVDEGTAPEFSGAEGRTEDGRAGLLGNRTPGVGTTPGVKDGTTPGVEEGMIPGTNEGVWYALTASIGRAELKTGTG